MAQAATGTGTIWMVLLTRLSLRLGDGISAG
jgi:hypothetical protein